LPALLSLLHDEDSGVRKAAAQALGALGAGAPEDVLPALLPLLHDEVSDVREAATQALGALGPGAVNQTLPALLPLLHDEDSGVREAAARAIAGLGESVTAEDIRSIKTRLRWPKWIWLTRSLMMLQWLCDWLVILLAIAAQVVVLWPQIRPAVPLLPIVSGLLDLTAWWQVLLILLGYLAAYVILNYTLVLVGGERNDERDSLFLLLNGMLQHIGDTSMPKISPKDE
jgi:hypothetical protein